MTHTPKTLKAAHLKAKDLAEGSSSTIEAFNQAILAGYDQCKEEKKTVDEIKQNLIDGLTALVDKQQKEIDELVEMLEYAKKAIKAVNSMGATTAIIERIDNGIQKHKR